MRIIMGSQSPRRAEIIRLIAPPGMDVQVIAPDIDEKAIRHPHPSALTMAIARAKNEAVRSRIVGDAVIVTADCVAVCRGEIREKPVDEVELRRFLDSYQETFVTAIASIWVHNTRTGWSGSATDAATVYFNPFTDRIDAIVADPLFYGSAGGFLIEHPLMSDRIHHISGDPETVRGMSGVLAKLLIHDALAS